jgi:hypothetical protein
MGHNRDQWNAEAVVVALYPWEVDVIERGLTCLAELAAAEPAWDHAGSPREPALAVVEKLDQVLELQGYGGLTGLRELLARRRGERESTDDLFV